MSSESKRRTTALVLVVFSFLYFICYQDYAFHSSFSARDFVRAGQLLDGQWFWHGPEVSGGGHLPGPLLYLLLAGYKLVLPGHDTYFFYSALMALTGGFIFYWLYAKSKELAWIGFLAFSGSPMLLQNVTSNLNPSAMPMFFVLACIFLTQIYLAQNPSRRSYLGLGTAIGLGLQLHGSILFLLVQIALCEFFLAVSAMHVHRRFRLKEIFLVLLPLIALCLPYWLTRTDYFQLTTWTSYQKPTNVSLWQVLQHITFGNPWLVLFWPIVAWASAREKKIRFMLLAVLLANLPALAVSAQSIFLSRFTLAFHLSYSAVVVCSLHYFFKNKSDFANRYLLAVAGLAGLFMTAGWFVQGFNLLSNTQGYFTAQLLILPALLFLMRKTGLSRGTIMAISLNLAMFPLSLSFSENPLRKGVPNSDVQACLDYVHEKTQWSYDIARHHIYFAGFSHVQDPRFLYPEVKISRPDSDEHSFILVDAHTARLAPNLHSELKKIQDPWDFARAMHPELRSIPQVSLVKKCGLLSLYTYRNFAWKKFSNLGSPYQPYNELNLRSAEHLSESTYSVTARNFDPDFKSNVTSQMKSSATFFVNCPLKALRCQSGVRVDFAPNKGYSDFLVTVFGEPLSQPSRWTYPEWSESWRNVELRITCRPQDKDKLQTFALPDFGGGTGIVAGFFASQSLAPFVARWPSECANNSSSPILVSLSIGSRTAYTINQPDQNLGTVNFAPVEITQ